MSSHLNICNSVRTVAVSHWLTHTQSRNHILYFAYYNYIAYKHLYFVLCDGHVLDMWAFYIYF